MSDSNEVQQQIASLSMTIESQQKQLDSLKDVPTLLQQMAKHIVPPDQMAGENGHKNMDNISLNLSDDEIENTQRETDTDDFANLFNNDTETPNSTNENDLAEILKDVEDSVEYGPDLLQQIAEGFTKTVTRPLTKETMAKLKDQLKIPSNCKGFVVPKMNPEIWNNLPTGARITDIKIQQMQQSISCGLITIANIANEVAKRSNDVPQDLKKTVLKLAIDGANLLGDQLQSSSIKRRNEVKKLISPEYSSICKKQLPVSELLFGENLNEALKSSKAASSVMRLSMNKPNRFRPYGFSRNTTSNLNSTSNLNFQRPFHRTPSRRGNQGQYRGRGQYNQRGLNSSSSNTQFQRQSRQ